MFADFVLRNIWEVYATVRADPPKPGKLRKMMEVLRIAENNNTRSKDVKTVVRAVMGGWLSCSASMLDLMIDKLPSPARAQLTRVEKLWRCEKDEEKANESRLGVQRCDPQAPVVAFVSKVGLREPGECE